MTDAEHLANLPRRRLPTPVTCPDEVETIQELTDRWNDERREETR